MARATHQSAVTGERGHANQLGHRFSIQASKFRQLASERALQGRSDAFDGTQWIERGLQSDLLLHVAAELWAPSSQALLWVSTIAVIERPVGPANQQVVVETEEGSTAATSADQLLRLTYTPTTNTLSQIRKMSGEERWKAGEQYVRELYGSPGQQHFPVPAGALGDEMIVGSGGRYVDAPVATSGNGVMANEVKTYKRWTTENGQPTQQFVPLSDPIQQQALKDRYLRINTPGYQPNWIFLDARPSSELGQYLNEKDIPYVIHN